IPAMVLGGFFTNVFAAAGRVSESAFIAVASNAAMTIASYAGITLGRIIGLYAASAIAGALLTVAILVALRRRLNLHISAERTPIGEHLRKNRNGLLYSCMQYAASLTYSGSLLAARYGVLHYWGE